MCRLWLSKCTDVVLFNPKVTHTYTTGGTNIEHKKEMLKHFFLSFFFMGHESSLAFSHLDRFACINNIE